MVTAPTRPTSAEGSSLLVSDVSNGKGSIGKLISDDELYRKVNGTVDKLNGMIDDLNAGKGTAGKFLKDEALYKNAGRRRFPP